MAIYGQSVCPWGSTATQCIYGVVQSVSVHMEIDSTQCVYGNLQPVSVSMGIYSQCVYGGLKSCQWESTDTQRVYRVLVHEDLQPLSVSMKIYSQSVWLWRSTAGQCVHGDLQCAYGIYSQSMCS